MNGQTGSPQLSASSGFIREGFRELGRKLQRRKLRKQAQQQEVERSASLVQLGQRAWQEKIDLSGFAVLRDQLAQLEGRAGELSASTQRLESQRASLEARQKEETGKFDGQRRAVEEKKRPVDAALRAARQRENEQQRSILNITARQASVAAELASLEQELASLAASAAPDQARKLSVAQTKKQQLLTEQSRLTEQLPQAQAALPAAKAEAERLNEESQRHEAEINRIEAERQAALSPILAGLQRVGGELAAVRQQSSAVEGERTERFKQLGLALHESQSAEPALAQNIGQIAATDRARAATQAALEASLALTRTMRPLTMLKFWSTVVLVPVLLIGLGCGIYAGWAWWEGRHPPKEYEAGPQINPYLTHSLSQHPAYVLANRLASARSEAAVRDLTLEAFRNIHLGVYTHDGRQILAGAERSDKDFFLYDFQWKTLARAYYRHDVTDYSHHSALLGKALLETEDSAKVEAELSKSILQRYRDAQGTPDDPSSFLILLVDGLARQQLKPYSLSEVASRPSKDLLVDPLQSFLIMLDFFVQQPENGSATTHWWPQLVPPVYADSPCSIVGDQGQKGWGWGVKLGGLGLPTLGKGTQITGAIGDLILLYGVTIKISPTNYNLHLTHEEKEKDSFIAMVTFEPDGVPEEAIKCGWLAGKTMPQAGEHLKDVELTWNIEPVWPSYLVVTHETVQQLTGHLGFQTKTDSDGQSIFEIEATDCPHKKDGNRVVGRDLMMTATARMLTTKMPTPGTLGWISLLTKLGPGGVEYLMNGRTGYCRFRAEWHEKSPKRPQRSSS
ncbi:MAG: hypothetical protein ABSA70_14345 [Terriglobia bacterium]